MSEVMNYRPESGAGSEKKDNLVEKKEMMSPDKAIDGAVERLFNKFNQSI